MRSEKPIIAIGSAYVDINADGFPFGDSGLGVETEVIGNAYRVQAGGSAINFARMCARLDIPSTFVGKVGEDTFATLLNDLLRESGVMPALITASDVQTNLSFNMVSPAGKSIMTVVGSANQSLSADEVQQKVVALLGNASYLYLGGVFKLKDLLPAYASLIEQAKQSGTIVVMDHGRLNNTVTEAEKTLVRELALQADIYLPSSDEFLELWDGNSIEQQLEAFHEKSTATVIVKDGGNGAVTLVDGKVERIAPFAAEPRFMIGAGDSFNAGFIAAHRSGQSTLDCIRFGSATAAIKITTGELPSSHQVQQLIHR